MIKCNQCGKMNAAGTVNCQLCGMPLSSTVDGGLSPRSVSPEQPELPAWLESLRAGERSTPPAKQDSHFSAADFVDEDSLPSWMRAQRDDARDNTGATPRVSVRPSSSPAPITDGESQSSTSIPARSLLDEQALPSWIRESKQSGSVPAQEKIAASSLVQPENMPDWMKSLQKGQASFPAQTDTDIASSVSRPAPSQVFSPTPQTPAPSQRLTGGSPSDSHIPSSPVTPSPVLGQSGFSARDLVDPQSLPSWMVQSDQAGQPAQSSQTSQSNTARNPGQPALGQTFSASSLLDMNSLPTWLRESGQGGQAQGQSGPPANQSFPTPSATPPVSSGFGGTIPASSFLDMNSVPEWMRQVDAQQPNNVFGASASQYRSAMPPVPGTSQPNNVFGASASQYQSAMPPVPGTSQPNNVFGASASQYQPAMPPVPGTSQPNAYAGPPRVENVRVPNRPRNAINPNENSEVAANVFSSMLGVASSTPNYPMPSSQSQSSYQQPGLSTNPAQPNVGYPASQSATSSTGPANYYGGSPMGAAPNTPGMSSNMPPGYAQANNYAASNSYNNSYQGGMGSSQMGNPSSAGMQLGASGPMQRTMGAANEQKNAKKRGLFGAIFEWLRG